MTELRFRIKCCVFNGLCVADNQKSLLDCPSVEQILEEADQTNSVARNLIGDIW